MAQKPNKALQATLAPRAAERKRSALAARGFLAELDLVLGRVLEAPDRWPQFEMGTWRYVFPRYPFNLIYRIKDGNIEVIAVAHHRRRQDYWNRRQ